jgi:nucleoside-diphosphate-sugar epimerase
MTLACPVALIRLWRMTALRILFIGGTGTLSSACGERALAAGHELTLLNRGRAATRPAPAGAELLCADIRDAVSVREAVGAREFDVVADFVAFTPEHVLSDVDMFAGRVGQYIFISSASAYQKPPRRVPVTESTPLHNPFWPYSQDKIACEEALIQAYRDRGFPVTIVRPSHTYDRASIPLHGGWTQIDRMRRGLEVIVPGDGTSLWTLTHHVDFAKGFVGLLGHTRTIGEAYTITGDDVLTWNQIYTILAAAAGAEPRLVHLASERIAAVDPEWGAGLVGDKAHSMLFDTSKLRTIVPDYVATIPFEQGAREIVAWHNADPARRAVDDRLNATIEKLLDLAR